MTRLWISYSAKLRGQTSRPPVESLCLISATSLEVLGCLTAPDWRPAEQGRIGRQFSDRLGNTALMTFSTGTVASRIRYYPYGSIRFVEGPVNPPLPNFLFTSQQQETGDIYHYNARMYNTDI